MNSNNDSKSGQPIDVASFVERYDLDAEAPVDWKGGRKWILRTDPMYGIHNDRSCYIIQHKSGAVSAGCRGHHDATWGWHELRAKYEGPAKRRSQADDLVDLAKKTFRLGITDTGEPFAVCKKGANVAMMLDDGKSELGHILSREFHRAHRKVPTKAALADALTTLAGEAHDCTPEPVALRVADHKGNIVIDMGTPDGKAIIVKPGTWSIASRSPVLFRRTKLSGAMAEPVGDGDLTELRRLLNISEEVWPLIVGWLVSALIPSIPHPVLMLGGPQGAGKTTAGRLLRGLVDPSPAEVQTPPTNPANWAVTAAASWVLAIDNVSSLPVWLSDALCKLATGDAWTARRLYTDSDLAVLAFKRVCLLTSIDAGALRGDLADRLLLIELPAIAPGSRRAEVELCGAYVEAQPRLVGGLLDTLAKVLAELPKVNLDDLPRMADFAKVLAALDLSDGKDGSDGNALALYLGQSERLAMAVIEDDAVGLAVLRLALDKGRWEGNAEALRQELRGSLPSDNRPKSPMALSRQLRRVAPALGKVGVAVDFGRATGRDRTRLICIECHKETGTDQPSEPSEPSAALKAQK